MSNDLDQKMQNQGIGRRTFLQGSAAAGAGVALAGTMGGAQKAQAAKKGGKFRMALGHGSTTDSNDPATTENDFTIALSMGYRSTLTEVSVDGDVVGDIAESWEASDDATEWVFKLKKGVEFHNGKTLTADDVVASFNHHRGEESKSAAKPIVAAVTDIKADGDNVVFKLNGGNADFPFIVSDYHLVIQPSSEGKMDWESKVGSGAYKLDAVEPGVRADLSRNPNWHGTGGYFDSVEMLTVADVNARMTALISGEVDFADRVDRKIIPMLKRQKKVRVEETSGTAHYTIPMNTKAAPFDNNDVRLALKYGLDREQLLQTILNGHGVVGNDHPIGRSNRYHADDLEQRAFDPDKAKFHLKKAGLSNLTVDLSASDAAFAGAVDAAVLYKESAASAGININVIREPADGYWSNVWMKKGWVFSYWGGRPTEDWMFSTAYSEGADWNETFWSNERFNQLLIEARSELDENKRREMYFEMQQLCRDEGGAVVPLFNNYIWSVGDQVKNSGKLAANWANDGQKAMERWWFG